MNNKINLPSIDIPGVWHPLHPQTLINNCRHLLLFDNGDICGSWEEEYPFAIMTHYLLIPETPKNDCDEQ